MTTTDERELWVSHSQLTKHRECPQRWFYSYERRYEQHDPFDVKVEMHTGSWWHLVRHADSLERGRSLGTIKWMPRALPAPAGEPFDPRELTVDQVLYAAQAWWKDATPLTQETWIARIGGSLPDRLEYMYARWREQWLDQIADEHPLAVEFGWGRDLPEVALPNGQVTPKARLVGYVDEVFFDRRRSLVVVRDHKLHKALSTQTTADDMMDSQLQLYAWGAAPEVATWELGPIRATAYDRVRMKAPTTPQVTQMGTLSKSITDFDLYTYREWAKGLDGQGVHFPGRTKDGSQSGFYTEEESLVEKLSSPAAVSVWFQRTLTPLNTNLIRAHLRAAVDSAADIDLTKQRTLAMDEAPRNLSHNNCRWCDFVGICRAEMVGGPGGTYDLADFKLRVRA